VHLDVFEGYSENQNIYRTKFLPKVTPTAIHFVKEFNSKTARACGKHIALKR
jgi:hypothetical protein